MTGGLPGGGLRKGGLLLRRTFGTAVPKAPHTKPYLQSC